MKKMSTSYWGWTVLFENLNGLGGPLNKLFTKNTFAQPIFRQKDNPFSPREVSNKKRPNFWTPQALCKKFLHNIYKKPILKTNYNYLEL